MQLDTRVQGTCLFHGYFGLLVLNLFHNCAKLENLYLAEFFVVLNFHISATPEFLAGCRANGLFNGLDKQVFLYSLVSTDLFNYSLQIRQHNEYSMTARHLHKPHQGADAVISLPSKIF